MNNIESEINIKQIAKRLGDLQDIMEKSDEEMAEVTNISVDEYREYKGGDKDFSYTFLYKAATFLEVDVTDIMTGDTPRLSSYSVTRANKGLPITRREGFEYKTMAHTFKGKSFNPLVVFAPYKKADAEGELEMSTHSGHEFNLIISGRLKIIVNGHTEILDEGDSIFYNAANPHGMAAVDECGCKFLAVLSNM